MKTQPSSLPVSERLRFFSSLTEASKPNSHSSTRSPPFNSIEGSTSLSFYNYFMATTPRSSTSVSSTSVTPTPMDYSSPLFKETPPPLPNEAPMKATEATHDITDSRVVIKADIVKTSPFLQPPKQPLPIPTHLIEAPSTPTSALTPTMKRIKLKAIGKLLLPSTFLNNDRNNNKSKDSSINKELVSAYDSNGENESPGPPKKIGKIKSPFIENCNQQQQKQIQNNNTKCMKFDYNNKTPNSLMALTSLENSAGHHSIDISTNAISINNSGALNQRKYQNNFVRTNGHYDSEEFSTDSGKENVDTSLKEQTLPVVEIRRKFSRKANTSQSFNTSTGSGTTPQLTTRANSLNGSFSTPQVEDKYAKYFGVTTSSKSAKTNQSKLMLPSSGQQHKEMSSQPQAAANNRNIRMWRCSGRRMKRMVSVISELKKFEDIIVTEKELNLAQREFDSLLISNSMLEQSSKELDNLFSSIV